MKELEEFIESLKKLETCCDDLINLIDEILEK